MKRFLLCLLSVAILLNGFCVSFADKETETFNTDEIIDKFEFEQFPEVMSEEDNSGRVLRVDTDKDPLNTIKYYVGEQQYETLFFPVDVKYVDVNGFTKDKSNKIYETEESIYSYESRDNDIISKFSKYSNDGVETKTGDYSVKIVPMGDTDSIAVNEDNSICYKDVFGPGIDLVYRATFTGNKSDIIIRENRDRTVFPFMINTTNCTFGETELGVALFDLNGNVIAEFGQILIYDSCGIKTYGSIEFVSENTFNVCVPEEYLNRDDLTYPITVDPSVTFVRPNAYGSANMIAATINEANCSSGGALTQASTLPVGNDYADYCQCAMFQFPGLLNMLTEYQSCDFSAYLKLFYAEEYYGGRTYVYARPVTIDWMPNYSMSANIYNRLFHAFNETCYDRTLLQEGGSSSGYTNLKVTTTVNAWKNGSFCGDGEIYGLRISLENNGEDTENAICYCSPTTAYAQKMPRLSLTYSSTESSSLRPIQEGIYILTPYKTAYSKSSYCAQRYSDTSTKLATPDTPSEEYYPNSPSGSKSYIISPAQLFRVKFYEHAYYTIQSLKTDKYLTGSGTSISYNSYSENAVNTNATWFIIKVGSKCYILSRDNKFLYSGSPATSGSSITMIDGYETSGTFWDMKLYCLDVKHFAQQENYSCGTACARMLLEYFNLDVSNYSDVDLWQYGMQSVYGGNTVYYTPDQDGYHANGYPQYGVEQVQKTVYKMLTTTANISAYGSEAGTQEPYRYLRNHSLSLFTRTIEQNINSNHPVICMISLDHITAPFQYTLGSTHFVVVAGLYKVGNETRVIVLDPFWETQPSYGSNTKCSYLDMPVGTLYDIFTYSALIRNDNIE